MLNGWSCTYKANPLSLNRFFWDSIHNIVCIYIYIHPSELVLCVLPLGTSSTSHAVCQGAPRQYRMKQRSGLVLINSPWIGWNSQITWGRVSFGIVGSTLTDLFSMNLFDSKFMLLQVPSMIKWTKRNWSPQECQTSLQEACEGYGGRVRSYTCIVLGFWWFKWHHAGMRSRMHTCQYNHFV